MSTGKYSMSLEPPGREVATVEETNSEKQPGRGRGRRRGGCPRPRCGPRALASLAVVALATTLAVCLWIFRDAPSLFPDDGADELPAPNATDAAGAGDATVEKAYIVNAPPRCEDGYRFFRGKCRKVF